MEHRYRIMIEESQATVWVADVVQVGTRKKSLRVRFHNDPDGKLHPLAWTFPTLKEAIEYEITRVGYKYGSPHPLLLNQTHRGQPWKLADSITKLLRLYGKLRKRHLV